MGAKSVCRKSLLVLTAVAMALAASLAWGASHAHAADDASRPYEGLVNNPNMKVNFNGYEWFVIADNSTSATEGSLKLLAANNRFGESPFNSDPKNYDYMQSSIKRYLDQVVAGTAGEGKPNFSAVEFAMLTNEQVGSKLYLLDLREAEDLYNSSRSLVTTQFTHWWTKTSTGDSVGFVVDSYDIWGHYTMFLYTGDTGSNLGVVPALQLDLSKVTFDSGTRTFYPMVDVTGVSLDKTTVNLRRGDTVKLRATVRPENSVAGVSNKTVTWSSSDPGIATVDENGVVTAIAGGKVDITATATNGTEDVADDKTATCTVNVDPKWANPMTYPATQKVRKTYSASPQTAELALAANAQGDVAYQIDSQKSDSGDVQYFSLDNSGKTLTLAAGTLPGKYTVVVRATTQGNKDYYPATKVSTVTVEVAKLPNLASINKAAVVPKGGSIDLAKNVTMNGAEGPVKYLLAATVFQDPEMSNGCTLNGSILTSSDSSVVGRSLLVGIAVPEDAYHNDLIELVSVTVIEPGQAIEAAGVTATYGDTDKAVSARVTDPATGGGAISYAVKAGSEDYIDVDATNGKLTIKKVPADGKAYVTVTAEASGGYSKTTKDVEVAIDPMPLTIGSATAASRAYEPGNTAVSVSGVAFKNNAGEPVNLSIGADYTAIGAMGTADAGEGKSVDVAVVLANGNYSLPEGNTTTTAVGISKATAPTQSVRVMGYMSTDDQAQAWVTSIGQSVAGMVPSDAGAPLGYAAGNAIYEGNTTARPDSVKSLDFQVSTEGYVAATLEIAWETEDPSSVGEITLPVTVSSKNYENATINVILAPTNRAPVDVSVAGVPGEAMTYGDGTFALTATAKVKDSGAEVQTREGDWWWYSSDPSVLEVAEQGGNPATVTVKGAGSAMIMAWYEPSDKQEIGEFVTQPITVGKRPLTITAGSRSIYLGGTLPDLSSPVEGTDYVVGFDSDALAQGDSLSGVRLAYAPGTDAAKPGIYGIVPGGATVLKGSTDVSANYDIAYQSGSLTVKPKEAQTISAADVAATYGDAGKAVSATTDGGGTISYAAKAGSEDCIDVNAETGALTIKKVPADGKAYVTVTASETSEGDVQYAQATKDVAVTIGKAPLTITAKNQSIYVGGEAPVLNGEDGRGVASAYDVTGLVGSDELAIPPTLSYSPSEVDATDPGTYDIVPTNAFAGGNYDIAYQNGKLEVKPKEVQTVSAADVAATYGDAGRAVSATTDGDGTISYAVKAGSEDYIDVDASSGALTIKKAGAAYVTVTASETATCTKGTKDVRVTIAPMPLTIVGATAANRAYEPGNTAVSISDVTFKDNAGGPVNLSIGTDYTASGRMETAEAGEGKSVAVAVALANGNYSLPEGGSTTATTVDIAKATAPAQSVRVVGYMSTDDQDQAWVTSIEQSVAGMVPSDAGAPLSYTAGNAIYEGNTTVKPGSVKDLVFQVDTEGLVTATLAIAWETEDPSSVGEITLPVTVSSKNYEDATIDVILAPTKRAPVDVSVAGVPGEAKTYGDGTFALTATAKDKDSGAEVQTEPGDWWWYSSDPSVLEVTQQGGNPATVTVKGAGSAMIMAWYEPSGKQEIGEFVTQPITVGKRPLTITAGSRSIYLGNTPPELNGQDGLAKEGSCTVGPDDGALAQGDSLSGVRLAYAPGTDAAKPGIYGIVPGGATVLKGSTDVSANYDIAYQSGSLTVKPKEAQTISAADVAATYGDAGKAVSATTDGGGAISYAAKAGSEDCIDVNAETGALTIKKVPADGKAYVTVTASETSEGDVQYAQATKDVLVAIDPMQLTIADAAVQDRAYEPGNTTVAVSGVAFKNDAGGPVNLNIGTDYTASGRMETADAGEGKSVVVTLTLINGNYSFSEGGGTTATTVDITKAAALTRDVRVVGYIIYETGSEAKVTSISQSVADAMPADAGTPLGYQKGTPAKPGGVTVESFDVSNDGTVTATLKGVEEGGDVTLPVTVTSQNYEDSTVNVVVKPTEKLQRDVSIAGVPATKAYGDEPFTLTAAAKVKGTEDEVQTEAGDWWWYSSDPSVLEVEEHGGNPATVTVKGIGSATIMAWYEPSGKQEIGAFVTQPITVGKAQLTVTAKDRKIYVGGTPPDLSSPVEGTDYVVGFDSGGFADDDSLSGVKLAYSPAPDSAKPGTYSIIPSGATVLKGSADASANYDIGYVDGKLEIKTKETQTISAANVAAAYGDAGKAVRATSDGSGAISYAVKAGSEDYISVDATSGALTIKKIPADGKAYVTVTASETFEGEVQYVRATKDVTVTISKADLSGATVTLAEKSYVYDGKAKEPAAKVTLGGRELVAGTDYEVIYENNVDVGTATATVTGKGNYAGSAKAEFAIADEAKPEPMPEPAKGAMHRLYNPNSGEHFFTASAYERDAVVAAGWTYEGEGWTVPETGDPVYRLYNPNAGEHHYTRSEVERDHLVSLGWKDEGVGWFSDEAETVPLLRVYNPNAFANNHHYTASAAERDWLVSLGWHDEGTGWYGL